MKRTVALIYGGEGFEHEISCIGAENISAMIDRAQYDVLHVLITVKGEWFIRSAEKNLPTFPIFMNGKSGLLLDGEIIGIDVALPLLHGDHGEDGEIMGALKAAHIKFVGCDVLAGAVYADKITTKLIADALNIPTAKWVFSTDEDPESVMQNAEETLGYPMFIKPAALGSSIGISKVSDRNEFNAAYKKAKAFCGRVLIEECVRIKRELECAYLGVGGKHLFKIGEILSDGHFYDFNKKYRTETETKAEITEKSAEACVIKLADRLRRAAGVRQISRFDFFLTEEGEILFNEINTFPGMTKTSLYPLLTVKMGFCDGEFINRLISETLI